MTEHEDARHDPDPQRRDPAQGRRSVWHHAAQERGAQAPLEDRPLPGRVDVVVVGAGIVGLSTALLLLEAGCSVAVLESRRVGAGTTGHSTAKVSLLQGTRLSAIRQRQGLERTRAYVAGNRAGQEWLVARAHARGVPVQVRSAVTYAQRPDARGTIEHEAGVAQELGLPVVWREHDIDAVFPYAAGVALPGQAQLDPLDLLLAMADQVRGLGGTVHERTRATGVHRGVVTTTRGEVTGERVVLTTGLPFTDSGGFFARVEPQRSYALALSPRGPEPLDMYLSADGPTRSIRDAVLPDGEAILVGGNGHPVGRADSPLGAVADLELWSQMVLPGREVIASWSAQDYHPVDELPYVGALHPFGRRTLVATGFGKWGMAAGPAAAHVLAGTITGSTPAWAEAFGSWEPHEARGLGQTVRANLGVAAHLVRDRVASASEPTSTAWTGRTPPEGRGWTRGGPVRPRAVSTVDGVTREVSATCPHLGGVVMWNDAECTWDCPLHGSRFAADGTLIEGPAARDLTDLETPDPHPRPEEDR